MDIRRANTGMLYGRPAIIFRTGKNSSWTYLCEGILYA
uniref:Bm741 n=1 Tax=Brugia malayi TaxID=6279 RepID=A0A0J9Y3Y2_BRUMA|nr:Bm741 [Brugia malayi]